MLALIVVVPLLLIGGGAAAYFLFFAKSEDAAATAATTNITASYSACPLPCGLLARVIATAASLAVALSRSLSV